MEGSEGLFEPCRSRRPGIPGVDVDGLRALEFEFRLAVGMPCRETVPAHVALEKDHVSDDSLTVEHAS